MLAKKWEIRGLFGNEYAMENAVDDLKKHQGLDYAVLDRRNLSVRLAKRNEELEGVIKRTFEIHHGFVESEAPLGDYDQKREAVRAKKLRDFEAKKRAQQKGH